MKSGLVIIIGRSNVGKSTLLNALVGTKLAITTPQAQTTRDIIHGVVNDERGQIVFADTPGILKEVGGTLSGKLLQKVRAALHGIDVVLYVADPTRAPGPEERFTLSLVRDLHIPKILVINKIDAERKNYLADYRDLAENFTAVFEVSALQSKHLPPLVDKIFELLPAGEPLYPKNQRTNLTKEQWVAEIIREKLLHGLYAEVPYAAHVIVDSIEAKEATKKQPATFVITARVLTNQERYKKMIIGEHAHKIKAVGLAARQELESALNSKVFLDLEVKVDERWLERF